MSGSEITIGFDLSKNIINELEQPNVFVITDSNVALNYSSLVFKANHFVLPAGEDSKTLQYYEKIMSTMLEAGCNRKTTVIAIGGGVVGDISGFVASTYMRGVEWINIPTTLLSQVDSSVGGKTAVNLGNYKNIVGAFHLPKKVIVSAHFLYTLPEREWICGVGEIIKTAFLSKKVEKILDEGVDKLLERDESTVMKTVKECIAYKKGVVEIDLYESGPRKALNLGHTVGHALEKVEGHLRSHGEYVLIGLLGEAFLLKNKLDADLYEKIVETVHACGITVPDFNVEAVAKACLKDKKNGSGTVSVMLPAYDKTCEVLFSYEEIFRGLTLWKLSL